MRTKLILATAALLTLSAPAFAQSTIIVQETDPVMTESTVVIPGEVRTYVLEQEVPSVAYEGDVLIGKVIPDSVEIVPVYDTPNRMHVRVPWSGLLKNPPQVEDEPSYGGPQNVRFKVLLARYFMRHCR